MTRRFSSFRSGYSRGFTLIELMVSITIGLIVSGAVFATYLGTSAASKLADAQARMNEDAQAALTILKQQLRMAGGNYPQAGRTDTSRINPVYQPYPSTASTYSTVPSTFALSAFGIRGCNGTFSNLQGAATLDDLQCASGGSNATNSLAVSYEADRFNTVPTSANLPSDCIGVGLSPIAVTFAKEVNPGPYTYYVADNRFYIGASGAALTPTLYCKGNGVNSTAQPLVENIEDLQFSYGAVAIATASADLRTADIAGYLNATDTIGLTNVPNDPVPWHQVITVQICVLVRSDAQVAPDLTSGGYVNCKGVLTPTPDSRLRRAFYATAVLRNRRL